jgi:phenylacetate-CoA ligase
VTRLGARLKSATYFALKTTLGRSSVSRNFRWLLRHQFLPAEALAALQRKLLERLCRNAVRSVPAYRARFAEAGLRSEHVLRDRDALSVLRPVTRYDLTNQRSQFLRQETDDSDLGLEFVSTGGSTGSPLILARDAHTKDWSLASTFLFNSWVDLNVGVPYMFVWGAERDLTGQRDRLSEKLNLGFLHARRILSTTSMSLEKESAYLQTIQKHRDCAYLIGYANEIYNLASHSLEYGPRLNRPLRAVITTAENLTPVMRRTIEEAFGCTVLNRYGCRDAGDIASECEHQQDLHVNPLFTHLEVADDAGRPLQYGEEGQLIITSLHNYAMPLLRYSVGDRGVLRPAERCRCGREWPSIAQLTGRTNEVLLLPGGRRYRAGMLDGAFETLPFLKRYQIHQEAPTWLRIKLRSSIPGYLDTYRTALDEVVQKLRRWTQQTDLQVVFEQTNVFDKTPTGKEMMIVRSVVEESANAMAQ